MNNSEKATKILNQLKDAGYDAMKAFATPEEVEQQAACGQLAIITEIEKENK